jgi:hypothetical protein
MSDLTQSAQLAAVFDQYKIDYVALRFRSRNNATFVAEVAAPNNGVPTGYIAIDRDDDAAPASIAAVQEYDTCEAFGGSTDITVRLQPSVTPSLYSSGAFSGYAVEQDIWVDVANTAVPYYGVKGGLSGLTATTTSTWVWDITAEYIVSFKNVR